MQIFQVWKFGARESFESPTYNLCPTRVFPWKLILWKCRTISFRQVYVNDWHIYFECNSNGDEISLSQGSITNAKTLPTNQNFPQKVSSRSSPKLMLICNTLLQTQKVSTKPVCRYPCNTMFTCNFQRCQKPRWWEMSMPYSWFDMQIICCFMDHLRTTSLECESRHLGSHHSYLMSQCWHSLAPRENYIYNLHILKTARELVTNTSRFWCLIQVWKQTYRQTRGKHTPSTGDKHIRNLL